MKSWLILAVVLAASAPAFSCSEDGSTGFAPQNGTPIPVGHKNAKGLNEEQFNRVIDKGIALYDADVTRMGGKLEVERRWSDATANAFAKRSGRVWKVSMFGGLARHEAITEDGFALVLCHEIGHHLGGAPKVNGLFGLNRWASNEGQADYFATLKCLRRMFLNDNNSAIVARMNVPAAVRTGCAREHGRAEEAALCVRTSMAGLSTATWLARGGAISFTTPDAGVVRRTNHAHPAAQCRLDTYWQGALCDKSHSEEVSQSDEVQGTCHASTGHDIGLRPNCWFKASR